MSINGVGKKVNIKPLQQADSKDFKGGLRIDKFGEGVSEKDKAIFNAMDENKDGVVTQDELTKFFAGNEDSKGLDKNSNGIVTRREAKKFIKNNQTLNELQIDKKELLAFLNKAGQASENVKSCAINEQGQVVVTYNDGSTDTISPDASRINQSTNAVGDNVTTTFSPNGKKSSEVVVGSYMNQIDDCTTTTLYEADGETVKNITVTDSQQRVISQTEGNTVTNTQYDDATGTIYERVLVDGKLSKTTVKDPANNKTTVIEYDSAIGEDGVQLTKTRTETTGDEVKTYTFENGVKSTLTIKKGTETKNYEYNEAGTEARHVSTDVVKGNGIIEHQAFSKQNDKDVTTISIDGKNQSQSVFGEDGKVARTIKYADAPNGERATIVVIQDQESIADICNKFGMTQEEFEAFNKGNKNGLSGNVGAEVNVKGELEVTDSRFDGRLSSKGAIKAKNNRIYRAQLAEAKSVANQRQETVMLISRDKNYGGSWENVARDLYKQEGNTQYSKMDLKVRAQQLQKLNPEVKKFEYGRTVIRVAIDPAAMEMNDTVRKLSNGSDATIEWTMAKGGETHAWNIALKACQQTENDVARPLTPLQQGIRAKKIIELNPGVFDKTGKMINPPANGKLKVPAGYTKAYKKQQAEQKAKLENQYYVAAEQVYKTAVDKSGMSAVSTIKKQLSSVNSDHIVQFYESYNTYLQAGKSGDAAAWGKEHGVSYTTKGTFGNKWMGGSDDSSIYDTICSETGMGTAAGKQQRKDLCNDIFNRIATAAQKSGVSQADINNARNRFTSSMNAQFNASGVVNTTKMEQATDWLIGKIHEAKTGAGDIDTKTAQDAFKQQYAQSVNGAQESFDKNMENVTWVGTFTAWTANIFVDNTTVGQMEDKLGIAKGSLDKLNNCKTQAEFNTTYEQIFGVPFNAKNVATVMKLEENLQTIAQNEAQVQGINKSFATISRSNSISDYENWVTAGISDPQEKAQTLEAIYSQFGGADDISKLSEAAKMNAIRKAKDAEIAAIQAETKQLKGGKTTEQIREDISTLASASFGPNNNIAKEVEKFNGNINRAEMVGTVVTEIGVTLIPVGRVLSLAGKGVRLANGAYKAYKTGKTVKTATTAVKATKAATTTAKTTQVAADVSNAGGITNRVKNVVSAASKDPITRQSAQAGFNSGVLDYSKYGDAEHAVEHGLETAAMFEIGGRASKFSQKLSSDLEISSAAGRWAVEAGVTGTADTAAAFAQTTIINGQDLSTEDGMMNFGLDAAFAALGARGTRVKPQGAKSDGFNYGNTFKHQDSAGADPIIAHNSNVHVKTQKGIDNINAKTDELVRTSTDGAQLGGAHNELDALSNRAVRRSNQAKLDKKARTLSPEEQAKYDQSVKQHHKEETEHTFERHNELSEADFRTIGNSIKDAKTPNDLISLRRDLKQKEYSHGGVTAEYKALEDQIDNKLTNMIRNAGADDLDKISRQLADMKSQVQNDARLTGSLEKLGKEIDTRKAFLKDQKGSVEGILKNGKGFADANELDKVVDYIKTLDSEKALQDIDILRRGKKMTGQQKKVLDNAIESKKAELAQAQKEIPAQNRVAEETPKVDEAKPNETLETPQVKPEKIIDDVNSINISEIPSQYKNLWSNCKERISQITEELVDFKGDIDALLLKCNNLFSDLRKIASNTSSKVKEQIEKIISNIQSMLNPKRLSTTIENYTPVITTKQYVEMSQIANSINGVKNLDSLNKLQALLDKIPECQQKSLLQNQLKQKYQQIGVQINVSNNISNIRDFSSQTIGTQLPKNEGVLLNGNENLCLSNFDLDLSSPEIRTKLETMNDGDVISVGRNVSGKNDIKINDNFDTVSGRHLEIKKVGNQFVVTDTSLNGTSIGKSLANVSDEIKSTFGHQTVKNFADLKPGDITTVTKGDIRYTVSNQNGKIQIVQAIKTTPTLNKSLKFDKYKMSSRCPSGEANPGKSMGELLTPQQKKVYSDSMDAFERSKNKRVQHNANNILTTDNLLHGTNIDALLSKDGILNNGLVPREISGNSSAHFSDGTVPDTLTPLCSDVWDIRESASIRDYFDGNNSHWLNKGESNFLPNSHHTAAKVVIVFDKNSIDPTIIDNSFGVNNSGRSVLFENGNMSRGHNYPTHRAVPIGMPSNSIDRIIIDTRQVSKSEIKAIQKKIQSLGLDIKLYDLEGTKLS